MTLAEMASEAVMVAAAKTFVVLCIAYLVVMGVRVARGAGTVWPDGQE